jgi:hypothetical protein
MSYTAIDMHDIEAGTFFMSDELGEVVCENAPLLAMSPTLVNIDSFTIRDTSVSDTSMSIADEVGRYSPIQLKISISVNDVAAIKKPYQKYITYLIDVHGRDDEGCCEQDVPRFDCIASFIHNGTPTQYELFDCHISVFDYEHKVEELILQITPSHAMTRITV